MPKIKNGVEIFAFRASATEMAQVREFKSKLNLPNDSAAVRVMIKIAYQQHENIDVAVVEHASIEAVKRYKAYLYKVLNEFDSVERRVDAAAAKEMNGSQED